MSPLLLAGYFLGAGLLTAGLNWLALIPWRRTRGEHWSERARALFPARLAARVNLVLIPICAIEAHLITSAEPRSPLAWVILPAWLGTLLGSYAFDREVLPWLKWEQWLREVAISWLLFIALWVVFLGAMLLMPYRFDDWRVWLIASVVIGLSLAFQYGASVCLLACFGWLQPPSERLARIVGETSTRLGVPVRRTWLMRGSASAAYALPTTGELLFSERLLETHPDDEVGRHLRA